MATIARESRLDVRLAPPKPASAARAEGLAGIRLAMMILLWMTLTGSLGMLLQATVRERANRSLESLLAAARPWEIVGGKLVGIGAVSALVVGAWLGSAALAAGLTSTGRAAGPPVLPLLLHPALFLRAVGLYGLSFAFYGLVTIALGARAKDSADAQNLARPMFALLLVVFFVALFSNGASASSWLTFLPPFTPFLLLIYPHPLVAEVASVSILCAATVGAGWWAVRAIGFDQRGHAAASKRRIV